MGTIEKGFLGGLKGILGSAVGNKWKRSETNQGVGKVVYRTVEEITHGSGVKQLTTDIGKYTV